MALHKFAYVVDGEVVGVQQITDENDLAAMWCAGLASNPKVIEVASDAEINSGWIFDGDDFYPPGSERAETFNKEPLPQVDPINTPDQFEFFAFVVDDDVTMVFPVHISVEPIIAALQSSPKLVRLRPYEKNMVDMGWRLVEEHAEDNKTRFIPEVGS